MRYKITAGDDQTYECVIDYLGTHQPGKVKVRLPNRRLVSAEDLSASAIRAIEDFGARVSEEYQFAADRIG
ncbi:MAG TPA: hypothetical protein VEK57_27755 [Thermoanaerobaculia bacterium]|nr:hypothetical protein [Thermoanaerobaculia bacterium]